MPDSIHRILDPEIVVPSVTSMAQLEFWERMTEWAADQEPRLGPSTMRALYDLTSNPPEVKGLPRGDFWAVLGKYMSRGLATSPTVRNLCKEHLTASYRPLMGASDNLERLITDLEATGPAGRIALSTMGTCWVGDAGDGCDACRASKLSHLHTPVGSSVGLNELAKIWRQAYKEENASSLAHLQSYASRMFPAIEFHEDAWKRLNSLVGATEELTLDIIDHLSVLNDHAVEIWADQKVTSERQAALSAKGVNSSPENSRIHKWKKAMNERVFQFGDTKVVCEWHTKLRPDWNRIHFAVEDGKVLVGVIVNHLLV